MIALPNRLPMTEYLRRQEVERLQIEDSIQNQALIYKIKHHYHHALTTIRPCRVEGAGVANHQHQYIYVPNDVDIDDTYFEELFV